MIDKEEFYQSEEVKKAQKDWMKIRDLRHDDMLLMAYEISQMSETQIMAYLCVFWSHQSMH